MISYEELQELPTYVAEVKLRATAPLTFDEFCSGEYFEYRCQIPALLFQRFGRNEDVALNSSLATILKLEARETRKDKRNAEAAAVYTHILDDQLPLWLTSLGIVALPTSTDATITLCNNIVSAYEGHQQKTGVTLEMAVPAAFDSFLRKLTLCLPAHGNKLFTIENYSRSSVVYCGHCDEISSMKIPMSLELASKHFALFHRHSTWKRGMLRQAPPGRLVFDGYCRTCKELVLVEASPIETKVETKSGVRCQRCGGRWCFNCMDSRVWLGPNTSASSGVRLKGTFSVVLE